MKSKLLSAALCAACTFAQAGSAQALEWVGAVGRSGDSSTTYRLGLHLDFGRRWLASDAGYLTGYWDAGYTYWDSERSSANHSLSVAPVFVYQFNGNRIRPFVEAGIGVAAFDDTQVEDKKLGSSFQFEDRLGAGLAFTGGRVGIRAVHYSNAGLRNPNDGIESYSLYYSGAF